jgi:hypothetical protein
MVRHNLALPLIGAPALDAPVSVSRLLLLFPAGYRSYQLIVLFGRAPPLS